MRLTLRGRDRTSYLLYSSIVGELIQDCTCHHSGCISGVISGDFFELTWYDWDFMIFSRKQEGIMSSVPAMGRTKGRHPGSRVGKVWMEYGGFDAKHNTRSALSPTSEGGGPSHWRGASTCPRGSQPMSVRGARLGRDVPGHRYDAAMNVIVCLQRRAEREDPCERLYEPRGGSTFWGSAMCRKSSRTAEGCAVCGHATQSQV